MTRADGGRSEQKREERPGGTVSEGVDPSGRRQSLITPTETLRIAVSLDAMSLPHHTAILKDLFWTLYSKLAAVLEGQRVVYEIARWIPSVSLLEQGQS